jgi:hypothetical protein
MVMGAEQDEAMSVELPSPSPVPFSSRNTGRESVIGTVVERHLTVAI